MRRLYSKILFISIFFCNFSNAIFGDRSQNPASPNLSSIAALASVLIVVTAFPRFNCSIAKRHEKADFQILCGELHVFPLTRLVQIVFPFFNHFGQFCLGCNDWLYLLLSKL
jgi:hypothetical protein